MAAEAAAIVTQKAVEVAATANPGTNQGLGGFANSLLSKLHDGGAEINIAFGVMALVIALLTVAVLYLMLRRSNGSAAADGELFERLESLESALRDGSNPVKLGAEVKGTVGYFKQELADIRNMIFTLQQQVSVVEQALSSENKAAERGHARTKSPIARKVPEANYLAARRERQSSVG